MQDNSSDPKRTNSFKAIIYFQEGCEMENVRAFGVIHNLEDIASEIRHVPEDVMIPEAAEVIRQEGLTIYFRTECSYVDVHQLLMQTIFLKELELEQISDNNDIRTVERTGRRHKLPGNDNFTQVSLPINIIVTCIENCCIII